MSFRNHRPANNLDGTCYFSAIDQEIWNVTTMQVYQSEHLNALRIMTPEKGRGGVLQKATTTI